MAITIAINHLAIATSDRYIHALKRINNYLGIISYSYSYIYITMENLK